MDPDRARAPRCPPPDRRAADEGGQAWTRNACDGWQGETGPSLQLIGPNLPDATDYEAERKCSEDCETHYHGDHWIPLQGKLPACGPRDYRTVCENYWRKGGSKQSRNSRV
jgi:hypothetical protein